MNNQEPIIKKFTDFMLIKGLSQNTQESYFYAINCLARHVKKSPEDINLDEIQQYILYLINEKKYANSSCIVHIAAFRMFYKEFLRLDESKFYLPRRIERKTKPQILSHDEIWQLFDHSYNLKHKTLLITAYSAGLRVSEVVSLKVKDIDSERMLIRVEAGKGGKDRYTILSDFLLGQLRVYWKAFQPKDWLFERRYRPDEHLCTRTAERIYRDAKERSGITKKGNMHLLRHSFATHMLESGIDLDSLQKLLGHSSITSTMKYLHLTSYRLKKIKSPMDTFMKKYHTKLKGNISEHHPRRYVVR
ncbi:MAG: tyrosine-type recombinase/integrase [bacterium]|nr:site-specific integrase [bacterium]MBU1918690.1 site-specific integrase [bacterium]